MLHLLAGESLTLPSYCSTADHQLLLYLAGLHSWASSTITLHQYTLLQRSDSFWLPLSMIAS